MSDTSQQSGNPDSTQNKTVAQPQTPLPSKIDGDGVHGIEIDPKPKSEIEDENSSDTAKRNQKETLDAIKKGERIALIIAGIVAFATIGQLVTTILNNRTSSSQTEKLITASQMAAHSADHNATAATSFAGSAESINKGIAEAVGKLQMQADEMDEARISSDKRSSDALQATIENFHQDQRAWIGVCGFGLQSLEEGKPFSVLIKFCNSGKTPAYKVEESFAFRITSVPIDGPTLEDLKVETFAPTNAVPPQGSYILHGGGGQDGTFLATGGSEIDGRKVIPEIPYILKGTKFLYVFGDVRYRDAFGIVVHDTQFCFYFADREKKELGYCKQHNELD